MDSGWTWDDSIFAGTARYYEQGRLPYAPGLADAFTDSLGADGTGRLLDVGCGPGRIALLVAERYRDVVGLDADANMLAEARRLAAERALVNATFVCGRAEHLPLDLGAFDAITFGASFHWMERARVASIVREMLVAGGRIVHVDVDRTEADTSSDRYPAVPQAAIDRLVRGYLGEGRRAGRSVGFVSPGDEDDVWRAPDSSARWSSVYGTDGFSTARSTTSSPGRCRCPTPPRTCSTPDWTTSCAICARSWPPRRRTGCSTSTCRTRS